jgi:hypothetical protein
MGMPASTAPFEDLTDFRKEVGSGAFPTMDHSYTIEDEELHKLLSQLQA